MQGARDSSASLAQFLKEQGLNECEISEWELSVMEGLVNGVRNVQIGRELEPLELSALVTRTEVVVSLTDYSPRFDWPEDPTLPESPCESGRGIFLITRLIPEVSYFRGRQSNQLILRKNRSSSSNPPSIVDLHQQVAELQKVCVSQTEELTSLTDELTVCYESLTAIFRFSEDIKRDLSGRDLVAKWLGELLMICGADWGVLRLVTEDRTQLATAGCAGLPFSLPVLPIAGFQAGQIPTEVNALNKGNDIFFDADTPFSLGSEGGINCPAGVGVSYPIFYQKQPFGVLSAGRSSEHQGLTSGQISILHTFGDFFGIQLRNLRLREEFVRGQLISRELEIAERIQRSLLPETLPRLDGYTLAGHSQNASQVGGDLYDAVSLTKDTTLIVVADVMGKGVPAALFAAVLRCAIRARPDLAEKPGKLMTWLNTNLYEDLTRAEMFATVQLVYFDSRSGECRIASAGHCPAILASTGGDILEIDIGGLPVGAVSPTEYLESFFSLEPGAVLLFYTDGVTDILNSLKVPYGLERLKKQLSLAVERGFGAQESCRELVEDLDRFREKHPPFDDVTFVLLSRKT